ncbi:DUF3810 domain-containing protein [Flavobacterium sp.]|uniref:DUF3810 domain-containing protein n=1 Tax=Flavobacterium sp. TaxID=239 RepID=UPI002613A21A|nr:DUF3810 domain-containing protein [Flavobacterium sp.]MDG2433784.1 DUF3810 domain-containing protein [Flavobacterium sp.]
MKSKYVLPLFLVLQIIFLQIIAHFPETVERYYSTDLFPYLSRLSRLVLGPIPFSVGDCLYFILIGLLLRWFWITRKSWKVNWKNNDLQLVSFVSVFYFFFHFFWALNYYRQPLFEKLNIEREYSDADLLAFTQKLILKTNSIHKQLVKNDSAAIVFPYTPEEQVSKNINGYKNLAQHYPFFEYQDLSVKNSLFSVPLTYMGFGGYLNPFTNEAQINSLLPLYSSPTTSCHEMAHQIGFASESECNFIGFLASIKNDDPYFKYSGYSFALRYCLYNWQDRDEMVFNKLLKTIHPGILKNYKETDDFWKQYESFIDKGFHVFYDNFLKINQQKDGINSYSKFVDLMVNYYKTEEL